MLQCYIYKEFNNINSRELDTKGSVVSSDRIWKNTRVSELLQHKTILKWVEPKTTNKGQNKKPDGEKGNNKYGICDLILKIAIENAMKV